MYLQVHVMRRKQKGPRRKGSLERQVEGQGWQQKTVLGRGEEGKRDRARARGGRGGETMMTRDDNYRTGMTTTWNTVNIYEVHTAVEEKRKKKRR